MCMWRIERCPPSSNTHYYTFRKIWWSILTRKSLQEEQFEAYLVHVMIVCGLIWKGLHWAVKNTSFVQLILLIVLEELAWSIVSIDYLIQFEVTTLEEAWFILCETWKCALQTFFMSESTLLLNWLVDLTTWPKTCNNKANWPATNLKLSTE